MTINEENYRSSVFAFLNGAIELKQLEGGAYRPKGLCRHAHTDGAALRSAL